MTLFGIFGSKKYDFGWKLESQIVYRKCLTTTKYGGEGWGWQKILHTDKNTDDGMSEVIYKFFQFPSL